MQLLTDITNQKEYRTCDSDFLLIIPARGNHNNHVFLFYIRNYTSTIVGEGWMCNSSVS